MTRPVTAVMKSPGVPTTPVQLPGKVNVTAFDGALRPVGLTVLIEKVYVPVGTPAKLNVSDTGSVSVVVIAPITFSSMLVGAPPKVVFNHDNVSEVPFATPTRLVGADGGAGTLTKMRISFDAVVRV